MRLYVKFMVSVRCKMVVKAALDEIGLGYSAITLGEITLNQSLCSEDYAQLQIILLQSGLELMEDRKAILIEKIKSAIIEVAHNKEELPNINFSDYLSEKLDYDYTYLSNLFSEVTGITIEYYLISLKIEKVKELLLYDELNLTQISYKLNYCSVAYLSNQFKKVTGLTPSFYKNIRRRRQAA